MAPKRPGLHEAKLQLTRESLSAASGDEEHRKAHLPPRSHEPEDHDITQMAQQMMDATKKRRQNRRYNAIRNHSRVRKRIQDEICISFDESSKRLSRLHKVRLQNFSTLLERKAAVEEGILESAKKLEKAFLAANQELRVTFGARLKDVGRMKGSQLDITREVSQAHVEHVLCQVIATRNGAF